MDFKREIWHFSRSPNVRTEMQNIIASRLYEEPDTPDMSDIDSSESGDSSVESPPQQVPDLDEQYAI